MPSPTGRVLSEFDDGSFRPTRINDDGVVLYDDFSSLSIENGQEPGTGARYVDSFSKWGVRRLAKAPNLDQGVKRYVAGRTHLITPDGLSMWAMPSADEETGYLASMISTERSLAFTYGRVDIRARFPSLPAGTHFTAWLMPANGDGVPEYDIFELIGSNKFSPDGPIDAVFMNAKNGSAGNWKQHNVAPGFLAEAHDYSFVWGRENLLWSIDGTPVHKAKNLYNEPMHLMLTWEVGASSNGDFPGQINESSTWPAEAMIQSIKVSN